jgi:hypothetical protein
VDPRRSAVEPRGAARHPRRPIAPRASVRLRKSRDGTLIASLQTMRRGAILLAIFVAACSGGGNLRPGAEQPATVTGSINLSGFPPEFRKGFTDGCSAARWGGAAAPPKVEGQYAVGWRDGFDYCTPRPAN